MPMLQSVVTVIYYCLIAYVAVMLIWNFVKTRRWQEEVLYVVVLIPFLLRLFRLK
jgi:hypothetical protein